MTIVPTETLTPRSDMGTDSQQLLDTLKRRNRNLHRVNEVSQKLASTRQPEAVMGLLVDAAAQIIGAPIASLWLWNAEHEALTCRATFPESELEMLRNYRIRPDQGVAGWVVTHGVSAVTDNAYSDRRFIADIDRATGFITQSMLAVPLVVRDSVIGVIEILNKQRAEFDDEDVTMVETLAAAASIALENATLFASLEAQNSELDAFAHTVAHDLKGPLSMILGFADMLESGTDYLAESEVTQICGTIARNAKKMDSIIKEILLLSGVRRKNVDFTTLDMYEVVQEALGRIEHLRQETDATFVLPDEWPAARGYAPWVEEVWVNYLSNALKYGGSPPHVELSWRETDDAVWFYVRDNGKGLTLKEQEKLFVPFTRLDQVRTRGHGLGLSIVYRIVTKLGGDVGIDSQVGQGSVFNFSLPRP